MSIARKILSNTFFQILGKIITAGLSIVIVKIITNYLGTGGYGQYTTIYEFLAFFGIAADLGFYTIAVREMSRKKKDIPYILGNVLSIRTLLTFGLMVLAALTALLIPQYNDTFIPVGVAIASLSTFLALFSGTISSILQVHLKMHYHVIALVISKIISTTYICYVVFYWYTQQSAAGFYQLLWAGVFGNILLLLLTYLFAHKFTEIRFRFDYTYWKEISIKALPYGVALILNTLYFRMDTILLSFMQDLEEVGIYGVAMRMLDVLVIIPVYFMNSVLPVMTRYLEENNTKIKDLIQYSFDFLTALGVPIVAGVLVISKPIIHLVSTEEFVSGEILQYGSDLALKILIFALLFSFINSLFGLTLVAMGKQIKLLWINLFCVIFNLVSNLIIIPFYSFRGAAFTSVLSELFILIATLYVVKKILKIQLSFTNTFKILASGIIMGISVYYLHQTTLHWGLSNLAIVIPTGAIIYGALLYFTKVINKDLLKLVKKK